MLLDNDYIYDINEKLLYGVAFLVYFINYLIFNRIIKRKLFFTVATVRLIQVLQFIVLFTISVYLMTYHNVKYSFVLIITAVILSFELYEFYHNRIQHRIEKSIASFTIKKNLKK